MTETCVVFIKKGSCSWAIYFKAKSSQYEFARPLKLRDLFFSVAADSKIAIYVCQLGLFSLSRQLLVQ